jgi:bifunctional UDP-N-acetylglucosamine pyrophosphorylase/glucosamine-1-phosphate N-acetyltransferase
VNTVHEAGRGTAGTVVGAGSMLGGKGTYLAPVTVGPGAYVAAGSTCDRPVPADALAIARARQEVKEGWAARRRNPEPPCV